MDRFLQTVSASLLAAPLAVEGQQGAKVARIGYLATDHLAASPPHLHEAFRQGLRDLGYVEGRNVVIEYQEAGGKLERLPASRPNWLRSRLMSSWPQPPPPLWSPSRRPGPSPLSSLVLPIRLRVGSSPALRARAAMSRGCPASPPDLIGKGLELLKQAIPGGQSGRSPLAARRRRRTHGKRHAEGSRSRGACAEGAASNRGGARSRRYRQGLLGHD
jgi:putative ABC transport system substrate-binding protein